MDFFDRHPVAEPICEILLVLVVSLGPLCLAAFSAMLSNPTFQWAVFGRNIASYVSGGEIALLVVSVCGAIVWVAFIRDTHPGVFRRTLFVLFAFFIAPGVSTAIIASNPGFEKELPSWALLVVVWLYFATVLVWLLAAIQSRVSRRGVERPKSRAKKILEEAES